MSNETKPLKDLIENLTPRQLRNGLRGAFRRSAKKAVKIAQDRLTTVGPRVKGNLADWKKGVRTHIYSRGGGFLVSVKARSSRSSREQGMHENRRGLKKPILMWMEDGTKNRSTRRGVTKNLTRRKPHNTGRIHAYNILKNSESKMSAVVEKELEKDVQEAVNKVAKKAGLI